MTSSKTRIAELELMVARLDDEVCPRRDAHGTLQRWRGRTDE